MVKNPQICNKAVFIHLFRKITQKSTPSRQHRDTQSDVLTHIYKACNQTVLTAIRLWQNTHTHSHIGVLAYHTKVCYYISRGHTNTKGENYCTLLNKHALRNPCSSKCQRKMNMCGLVVASRAVREWHMNVKY